MFRQRQENHDNWPKSATKTKHLLENSKKQRKIKRDLEEVDKCLNNITVR